jgi:hypothetical protein
MMIYLTNIKDIIITKKAKEKSPPKKKTIKQLFVINKKSKIKY